MPQPYLAPARASADQVSTTEARRLAEQDGRYATPTPCEVIRGLRDPSTPGTLRAILAQRAANMLAAITPLTRRASHKPWVMEAALRGGNHVGRLRAGEQLDRTEARELAAYIRMLEDQVLMKTS